MFGVDKNGLTLFSKDSIEHQLQQNQLFMGNITNIIGY